MPILGAGLDVFGREPFPEDHPLGHEQDIIMTPHSGGVTSEASERGLQMAVDNVFAGVAGNSRHRVD